MVNREVIGAHYGLRDWLVQRITAVVMSVFTVIFLVKLFLMPQFDYAHWSALWHGNVMRFAALLFFVSLGLHAWVGMRNIFMDYVKNTNLRVVLFAFVILALVTYVAWAVQILWGI
ncbi:MAG: succinate dehydrogenase, hydrophobic membrane anchor protein [Betaproteobacteria bacterium]|jgi:succinate dehydrogenase / fumarate reductase membrane anchor subunit